MLTRRAPRTALSGLLLAVAVTGLAGCRTAPNVAAYVGDDTVTVSELDAAVDDRLADPALEAFPRDDRAGYTRQVLGRIVQGEVLDAAAERYGVEVSDAEARDRLPVRLAQLFPGQDPNQALAGLATQGYTRDDVLSIMRQELIRLGIAEEEGLDEPLSDEALRERYEQTTADRTSVQLGIITVPDQRTADQVAAALNADPGRYADLARRFAGQNTLPDFQEVTQDQLRPELAEQVAGAEPGTAFTMPVEGIGVVVGFVGPPPSFEDLEPQLQQQAEADIDQAVQPLIDEVRDDLDVTINPRYGDLADDGTIELPKDGPVTILEG